eukprot:Skav231267  [mRNA]  locus=scaffold2436:298936:303420:+ [translate_table: standard]
MLLTEPDSKIKLAAGFGRHWPDARGELKQLYERLAKAMKSVAEATDDRHGWVTSCPSRLGAALRGTVTLRIPRLANAVGGTQRDVHRSKGKGQGRGGQDVVKGWRVWFGAW